MRSTFFAAAVLFLSSAVALFGQSIPNAVPMPQPQVQWLDASGIPLAGAKLCTYAAGTSTPLATYTDSTGSTPNTNPVILDAAGRASVWVGANLYKFVLRTGGDGTCSTGTVQWTQDNVADQMLYFVRNMMNGSLPVNTNLTLTGTLSASNLTLYVTAPPYNAKHDGVTDDSSAFAAAFADAAATCGTVDIPAALNPYLIKAQVTKPPCVNVIGHGSRGTSVGSFLAVSGAGLVGFLDTSDSASLGYYPLEGTWRDIGFACTNGAATALEISGRSTGTLDSLSFNYNGAGHCSGPVLSLENTLVTTLRDSLILNGATAGGCQVDVDGGNNPAGGGTTFRWETNYISGGPGATGGLCINGMMGYAVEGGAIESTGVPLLIQNKTTSTRKSYSGRISDIDLENPGTSTTFIDVGAGWAGSYYGVQNLQIHDVSAYSSGSTSITTGINLTNTTAVTLGPNNNFNNATVSGTLYNLVGTGNTHATVAGPTITNFASILSVNGSVMGSVDASTRFWMPVGGSTSVAIGNFNFYAPNSAGLWLKKDNGGSIATPAPVTLTVLNYNDGSHWQGLQLGGVGGNSVVVTPIAGGSGSTVPQVVIGDQTKTSNTNIYGAIINLEGRTDIYGHLNQPWNSIGGKCQMTGGTSCTFSMHDPFTLTPICVTSSTGNAAPIAGECQVNADNQTVTIQAAAPNSYWWYALVVGNTY